jgi:hypothetical protein
MVGTGRAGRWARDGARAAAGTAATASGQPRGRITAHASTASRAAAETVSAAAFRIRSSRTMRVGGAGG